MTSLEMAGMSITLLKVQTETSDAAASLLPALDLATAVNIWRVSPVLGVGIKSQVRVREARHYAATAPTVTMNSVMSRGGGVLYPCTCKQLKQLIPSSLVVRQLVGN